MAVVMPHEWSQFYWTSGESCFNWSLGYLLWLVYHESFQCFTMRGVESVSMAATYSECPPSHVKRTRETFASCRVGESHKS